MANIAYIRVSSQDQNPGRQEEALKDKKIDKWFSEKVSGKNLNRPQLVALLQYIREGDTVFIESISRLARNTKDFLTILEEIERKNVKLISLKEQIDTGSPTGRFLISIFAALAELERGLIKERQREGIDLAIKEGRAYGRPAVKISKTFDENYKKWKSGQIKSVDFMRAENLKKTTFYSLVKKYEAQQ